MERPRVSIPVRITAAAGIAIGSYIAAGEVTQAYFSANIISANQQADHTLSHSTPEEPAVGLPKEILLSTTALVAIGMPIYLGVTLLEFRKNEKKRKVERLTHENRHRARRALPPVTWQR